tara:strand:- start:2142 stop:2351 length:210 start_codon:yes stop_codon:yes gene_type:complete
MTTKLICFFLLGTAALLLNAGLSFQALPLFWLVLPLTIKIGLYIIRQRALYEHIKSQDTLNMYLIKTLI